jgi:hypothetical protein
MVSISCWSSSGSIGTTSDSLSTTFTTSNSITLAQTGSTSYTILKGVSLGGSDVVTVAQGGCSSAFSNQFSFSVDIYSAVTGIGAINSNFGTVASGTSSDTLTMLTQPASIIFESLAVSDSNSNCPSNSAGSGQSVRDTVGCASAGGNRINGITMDKSIASGGSTSSTGSWTVAASSTTFFHTTTELLAAGGSVTALTQCYGACGNPAITLVNTNATHAINFNQSFTIFYEFQSGINGVLLNVTVNSAKTYTNQQNIGLGVYTATCGAGQTPFTTACSGLLQQSNQARNPAKGRFSLTQPVTVTNGEWIGIAVSASISGFDLNNTNAGCGIAGDAGICVNPPGMSYTTGFLSPILSQVAACTSNGSPCNTAGISTTGLWAWITGNVIGPAVPVTTGPCTNNFAQLDCLLPALSNGACSVVTASCQTSGSLFWIIILTFLGFIVATVGMSSAHITRFIGAGEIFLFLFLAWFFIFAGVGLIESFVVIFFLFIGAAVFGKTARQYF